MAQKLKLQSANFYSQIDMKIIDYLVQMFECYATNNIRAALKQQKITEILLPEE